MCFSRAKERILSEMLGKGGRTVNRWAWFQNTHRRSGFISVQTNSIVTQRPVIDEFEKAEEGSLKTKATRKLTAGAVRKTVPPPVGQFPGTSGKAHGRVIMFPKPRLGNSILSLLTL